MNRGTILLLGVGAQIIITSLFLWRAVPVIEEDLATQARNALSARNINWARIEMSGRDLILQGLAPNEKMKIRALETLEDLAGVRRIHDRSGRIVAEAAPRAKPLPPEEVLVAELDKNATLNLAAGFYEFRIERESNLTTVSGMAPDLDARDSLMGIARQKFGSQLIDRLIVNQDAPDGFLFAATQALNVAEFMASGTIGVRDHELYVEGLAGSDRDMNRIRTIIDAALPDGYSSSVQLGSRQELDAVLRQNPDLAARVGPLPAARQREDGAISLQPRQNVDRSPKAAQRCQASFDEVLARRKINFKTASSEIDTPSRTVLDSLVAIAKSCPAARIEIGGHTDDQGTDRNNLTLSQRRAESVMEYLVSQGVALGRLTAVGYGENQPLVENRTLEDRATNRRIEFKVL